MENYVHTSASLRQLCQAKQSVVARNGLESDIRVPLRALRLPLSGEALAVELLGLNRGDDTNLVIGGFTSSSIDNWVDVELGSGWLARQLAQTLDKLLLKIIGDIILLTEEDNTTL